MKLHLPLSLRASLLSLFCVACTMSARASVMHGDVPLITYTDFGQNAGRFVAGETNALLQHIRERDGGIYIDYTGGQDSYLIPLAQGVPDFSATFYVSTAAALSPSMIVTVGHNGEISSNFTSEVAGIGATHAVKYQAIGSRYSDVYSNYQYNTNSVPDWRVSRQSKIFTDITPYSICSSNEEAKALAQSGPFYHAGSGNQSQTGSSWSVGGYQFTTGGISKPIYVVHNGGDVYVQSYYDSSSSGVNADNPLPYQVNSGDSGSPVFVYDGEQYKLWGSVVGMIGSTHSIYDSYPSQYQNTINRFNKALDMSSADRVNGVNTVYLGAVTEHGELIVDNEWRMGMNWYGSAKVGAKEIRFCGVKSGLNTWADLSDLKDTQNWYAYNGRLNLGVKDLFFTENLQFSSSAEQNRVELSADVDTGIGYVEFSSAEGKSIHYTVASESGKEYCLNTAGYVVRENTSVHLQLTNSPDYMREWRKTGEGDLYIEGSGNNNVLLNLGGSGKTYLNRESGYAAYNVLANSGTTVVLKNVEQIARDFTFGNGGATLDLNGNDMDWYTGGVDVGADGFTINALTEDAIIANCSGSSTLVYRQSGDTQYVGSFRDTSDASLRVVYAGGGSWTLNSVFTRLQHADSGLDVADGRVILSGTHTVHGVGSNMPTSTGRYQNEDDWHYADAAMNVTVRSNGVFELGSHARLSGNVTVEQDGTYVMREGVRHAQEYVEGGLTPEDTVQYKDYYGHKGNTHLKTGAELRVEFSEGTTANNIYAGDISGEGKVSVDTASGSLTLTGNNTFTGSREIIRGTLIAEDSAAAGTGGKWLVRENGAFALSGADIATALQHIDSRSAGVLALTQHASQSDLLAGYDSLFIGALSGHTVEYGTAGTQETLKAVNGAWRLGGGGGDLVVHYALSGNNQLILGNGYAGGTVTLASAANNFSATLVGGVGTTLLFADAAAAENVSLSGGYGVRLMQQAAMAEDFAGTLLLQNGMGDLSVSDTPLAALGADGDVEYAGNITLDAEDSYRFGGITGQLTVNSAVDGAHDLVVDNQGYANGTLVLNNISNLTGNVTVQGCDSQQTGVDGGSIKLVVTQEGALSSASSVELRKGATLDIAGTAQQFNADFVSTADSLITDSSANGGGSVTFALAAGEVLDSVHGAIDADVRITNGRMVVQSADILKRTVDGADSATLEMRLSGEKSVNGGNFRNLAELHVSSGSLTAVGALDAALIRVNSGAQYATGSSHSSAFVLGGDGLTGASQRGALSLAGNVNMTGAVSFAADTTLNVVKGWNATISGAVNAGGHALTKSGQGNLTISGTLTNTHEFCVESGKLALSSYTSDGNTLQLSGGGELSVSNWGERETAAVIRDNSRLALAVNGNIMSRVSGNGTLSLSGVSYINSSFSDAENGKLALEIQGNIVTYNYENADVAASTHSGGTTLSANVVYIYHPSNLGQGEVVQNGGTIWLVDWLSNLTVDSLRGSGTVTRYTDSPVLNLTGALSDASHVASYKGALGVSVTKSGQYTQEFRLTGNTTLPSATVNGGALRFMSDAALNINSLNVASGATLALGGSGSKTLGSSTINGTLDLSSMMLTDGGGVSVAAGSTLSFASGASLVLGGLENGKTYSVIDLSASGASLIGWSQSNISVRSTDSHGAGFTLLSGGKLSYTAGSHYHDLIWTGGETGGWNTQSLNWRRESDASAQASLSHDSVIFESGDYRLTQQEDITLTKLMVRDGAKLSLANDAGYAFSAEQISVENGGYLRVTDSGMGAAAMSISGGGVVEAEGAGILESGISLSGGGVLRFTGTVLDTIDYNNPDSITVRDAVVDFGTTRQNLGGWSISLSDGARLIGSGSTDAEKSALVYQENGTISVTGGDNLISAPIRVRTDKVLSIDVAADAALDVKGIIQGNGSIVKEGVGVLELSGNGSYSGTTTVKSGVLRATVGGALGSSSLEILSGATAEIEGDKTLKGNVTVHSGARLNFTGSAADSIDYNVSRNLSVNGGVVDVGGTRQTMGSWNLTLSSGASVTGVTDGATTAQAVLDYNAGGTITSADGNNSIDSHIRVRNNQTLTLDVQSDSELTLNGMVRSDAAYSSATLTKTGDGALVMTRGRQSFTGLALNVNTGRVVLNGADAFTLSKSVSGSGILELARGTSLEINGAELSADLEVNGHLSYNTGRQGNIVGEGKLGSNVTVNKGAVFTFIGSGYDAFKANTSGSMVVDGGTVDFGSTRQTVRMFNLTLKNGAILQGEGGSYGSSAYAAALDFNNNSTISVEGTGNLISANIRLRDGNARTLTYHVAEDSDLEVSGRMHADTTGALGNVSKTGEGNMTISQQTRLSTLSVHAGELAIAYTGKDGNTLHLLDGSMGGVADGTLRLAQDVKLTVANQIWGRKDSSILLESDAELTSTQDNVAISNRRADAVATLRTNTQTNDSEYAVDKEAWELTNAHIIAKSASASNLLNKLVNTSVENAGSGKLTVNNASNSITDVFASDGDMAIMQQAAGLNLEELLVAAGKTVSAYTGANAIAAEEADVTVRGHAEFGKGAVLNANLTLASGSSLSVAEGGLAMGSTLSLQKGITLDDTTLNCVYSLNTGESLALFTGVDGLTLGETSYASISENDEILASPYFTNLNSDQYHLTYTGPDNGTLAIISAAVPEPATATLSLLALAALAARRRRK